MTSASYLEHYLDSLENLPVELQRNFKLMRELDSRAQEIMKQIDKTGDDYLNNIKIISTEKKKEHINEIQKLFTKAKEYADDKVQLAIQTYELVDKHIRRLDSDLARFEAEIQDKAMSSSTRTQEEPPNPQKRGRKKLPDKDVKKKTNAEEEAAAKANKKKQKKATAVSSSKIVASAVESNFSSILPNVSHSTDAIDMPVDPNEPTYCLCNQVSYGEMIGCDNSDCPIEWFHFACVKLTTKPKGKWYCPKCIIDRKKK
ncbi:inhibitor of growth protein 5-like isoform X2 [Planococcus citri]|uniref:inhibitor of growth protein 5-like isoform X2 n=1 Tax=Planococcus citri TaxID=170843 RepID=UPI0031F9842D